MNMLQQSVTNMPKEQGFDFFGLLGNLAGTALNFLIPGIGGALASTATKGLTGAFSGGQSAGAGVANNNTGRVSPETQINPLDVMNYYKQLNQNPNMDPNSFAVIANQLNGFRGVNR